MKTEQLADLFLKGVTAIDLDPAQATIDQFLIYLQELVKWNAKINLTGHKNEQKIIGNLFIDSLACTKVFLPETACSILDIGSGAGFPGIPIGIVAPQQNVTLLEPNLKKVAFLHHIIGVLGLKNVRVEPSRIEHFSEKPEFHEKFDWVFMKALRFDVGLSYVRPILSESGKCVLCRTEYLTPDLDLEKFSVVNEITYKLPFESGERVLSIVGPAKDVSKNCSTWNNQDHNDTGPVRKSLDG